MTDGIGLTTYTYHAAGILGAGQVAAVDGPLAIDTITYTCDELGRVESRAIDGSANTVTWGFDALGRVQSESNLLGTFTYSHDGVRRFEQSLKPHKTKAKSYHPPKADDASTATDNLNGLEEDVFVNTYGPELKPKGKQK
jgi:hypothetical protein